MTYDWYNSLSFDVQPGTGTGDVHGCNWIIYTATREIILDTWFNLVPGNTDLWDVTLTLNDWNHTATDHIDVITIPPGPMGNGDAGDGSKGPYVTGTWAGWAAVPSWARIGPGVHTMEFNEVGGDFFVNFDGAWYDLSPDQSDPSYDTPAVCYHTTEGAWYGPPSCWPVYSAGCSTSGYPKKPAGSLAVVYGDGSGANFDWEGMAAYGNPVLGSANSAILLTLQTSLYSNVECLSFDPRGVFWTRFQRSFET